jgi:hypothetical protein
MIPLNLSPRFVLKCKANGGFLDGRSRQDEYCNVN